MDKRRRLVNITSSHVLLWPIETSIRCMLEAFGAIKILSAGWHEGPSKPIHHHLAARPEYIPQPASVRLPLIGV